MDKVSPAAPFYFGAALAFVAFIALAVFVRVTPKAGQEEVVS